MMLKGKKIKKSFILISGLLIIANTGKGFALEDKIVKDLENFIENYQVEEFSEDIFEKLAKSDPNNKVDVKGTQDDYLQKLAISYLGKAYRYGATGPNEFDCSAFVQDYHKNLGKKVPRTVTLQSEFGDYVSRKYLKVGDVVFFDTRSSTNLNDIKINIEDTVLLEYEGVDVVLKDKATHSGIYIGDDKFVHASSGNVMKIVIDDLNSKYFSQRYLFSRRFL